jgi:hypothetical protein
LGGEQKHAFQEDSAFANVDESQLERTISSWKRRAQFCSPREKHCGQRHKSGTFTVWRITAKKRMVAKLKAIKVEPQRRMHDRMAGLAMPR